MKRAALIFVIAYVGAFGFLYGLAQFITARELNENWAIYPFRDVKGGSKASIEYVFAHIIASPGDDGFSVITYVDHEVHLMENSQGLWPEDLPGNRGFVTFMHAHGLDRKGPFIIQRNSRMRIDIYLHVRDSVPIEVLNEARIEAIAHAHASFDMPHFTQDELPFDDGYTPENWIGRNGPYEFLIPLWLIIILFAFTPLAAAWAFTSATTRLIQTESRPSPPEGEGGREADG